MRQTKAILLALFAAISVAASAQMAQPVKVKSQLRQTSPTAAELVFDAAIEDGWHMYSTEKVEDGPNNTVFHAETLTGAELDGPLKAVGNVKKAYDNAFGTDVFFFEKSGQFVQKLRLTGGDYKVEGYLQYSACNDQRCTPPTDVEVSFSGTAPKAAETPGQKAEEPAEEVAEAAPDTVQTAAPDSLLAAPVDSAALAESDWWRPVTAELKALDAGGEAAAADSPLWKIFLLGLLGGFVALFTPCVWPIIPMTVSYFLKRSGDKRRGIRDAWIYGASIVVIYVALGLIVSALLGPAALNNLSTNAVVNLFFCALLVVFAASFLGAFELTLPSSWSSAVDSKAEKTGGLLGIFLMAFTLALVSFSCTGPIIGFLLVEVSQSGWLAPAVGMLGFAIALALPFTLFAMFPSWLKQMPKSGGWMNTVKVTLGFIELAFALKFFSVADLAYGWHLLDRETFLALWIALFALLGIYLLGRLKFKHDDDDQHIGVARFFLGWASLAFAIYMVPGLWGAPLKAVSAFAPPMKTQDFNLMPEQEVKPMFTDYDAGMAYAAGHGMPVMIDFTGYGCVNCRKMEAAVWTDQTVASLMRDDYVLIQLYVDDKTALPQPVTLTSDDGETHKLRTVGAKWSYLQSHKFGNNTQPFYVLLDNQGLPLTKPYTFDDNVGHFIQFLKDGLDAYGK